MRRASYTRWATLAGFAAALGCSGDPPAAVGGSGGAAGSTTTPVAGTAGIAAGGSSTGGNSSPSAGTGGSGIAGGGAAGLGGSSGAGGSLGGTGGSSGGTGGGAGAGGSLAGAGGADPEGWVNIFNGQDLTNWKPLIHKSGTYGNDPLNTFRIDPATHVIRVTYVDYPKIASGNDAGRADFGANPSPNGKCGLLYYDKPLTNYRVRATYRFVDESIEKQAANAVGWGHFNSGLMIFGTDPSKVMGDPQFPPVLEIQLLGNGSSGGSTSPNICNNGGMNYSKADCGKNSSGVPAPAPTSWVTVEAEVHPGGMTTVYTYAPGGKRDSTKPIETVTGVTNNGTPLTAGYMGYISLQSESQPCEFKDIQLIELSN